MAPNTVRIIKLAAALAVVAALAYGDDVARGPCSSRTTETVPNGRGLAASVRETSCSGNWGDDVMYFVFVHPAGLPNTRQDLVYRYTVNPEGYLEPPTVRWITPASLRISTGQSPPVTTTLQRTELRGTAIGYDFSL